MTTTRRRMRRGQSVAQPARLLLQQECETSITYLALLAFRTSSPWQLTANHGYIVTHNISNGNILYRAVGAEGCTGVHCEDSYRGR